MSSASEVDSIMPDVAASSAELSQAAEAVVRLYYPEVCATPLFGWPGEQWLTYFCESFLLSPFWTSALIADCLALWLIFKILRRQREQTLEYRRARLAVPSAVRVRRNWSLLATTARLASCEQVRSNGSSGAAGERMAWPDAWKRVREMREYRKTTMMKIDFHLPGVMMRAFGAVLVLVMTLLILFEVRSFYMVALPMLGLPPLLSHCMGGVPLLAMFCIFYNYANVSLRDPGTPGLEPMVDLDAAGCSTDELERSELGRKVEALRCIPCNSPKPPRAHHCKICRRCVMKMDHHCPFVNNCIGARNHRYFLMFLISLVLGCAFLAVCLAPQVNFAARGWGTLEHPWTRAYRVHVLAAFIVALAAVCLLGPFFYFHLRLVLVNQTTLERMKVMTARRHAASAGGSSRHIPEEGYSRGALDNFVEVFGAPPARFRRHLKAFLEKLVPAIDAKRSA